MHAATLLIVKCRFNFKTLFFNLLFELFNFLQNILAITNVWLCSRIFHQSQDTHFIDYFFIELIRHAPEKNFINQLNCKVKRSICVNCVSELMQHKKIDSTRFKRKCTFVHLILFLMFAQRCS